MVATPQHKEKIKREKWSMSDEAFTWLQYARKNLKVAEMTLQAGLLNPCLQNARRVVEKALKAIRVRRKMSAKRTHSIRDLNRDLSTAGLETGLTEEDCELLDSIYVISKHPSDLVSPHSPPDLDVCRRCVELAKQTLAAAENMTKA
jgi:HEPN domain-containing protein